MPGPLDIMSMLGGGSPVPQPMQQAPGLPATQQIPQVVNGKPDINALMRAIFSDQKSMGAPPQQMPQPMPQPMPMQQSPAQNPDINAMLKSMFGQAGGMGGVPQ